MRVGKRNSIRCVSVSDGLVSAVFLGGCFFLGAMIGLLACFIAPDKTALSDRLLGYFKQVAAGGDFSVNFLSIAWDLIRWPLFAVVLGMTRVAVVAIPVVLMVRGFLLAHAITVFSQLFGVNGWIVAMIAFGITSLVMIPIFFAVCFDRFHAALLHRAENTYVRAYSREHIPVLLVWFCGTLIAIALQCVVASSLMPLACARLVH